MPYFLNKKNLNEKEEKLINLSQGLNSLFVQRNPNFNLHINELHQDLKCEIGDGRIYKNVKEEIKSERATIREALNVNNKSTNSEKKQIEKKVKEDDKKYLTKEDHYDTLSKLYPESFPNEHNKNNNYLTSRWRWFTVIAGILSLGIVVEFFANLLPISDLNKEEQIVVLIVTLILFVFGVYIEFLSFKKENLSKKKSITVLCFGFIIPIIVVFSIIILKMFEINLVEIFKSILKSHEKSLYSNHWSFCLFFKL